MAGGVRRIEAVTEAGALEWIDGRERALTDAADMLKVSPEQLAERVLQSEDWGGGCSVLSRFSAQRNWD